MGVPYAAMSRRSSLLPSWRSNEIVTWGERGGGREGRKGHVLMGPDGRGGREKEGRVMY